MAPTFEGSGLTSALKQVYYIHKGIVAELTSKNQILEEECKKLKSQLKVLTSSSPGTCGSCLHMSQLNRSLQRALQKRAKSNLAASGLPEGKAKDKDSKVKREHSKTKIQQRKRPSDEMAGKSCAMEFQDDYKSKRRPIASECYQDLEPEEGLHPLEKSTESDGVETQHTTVLAPETELMNSAWRVPDNQQRCKVPRSAPRNVTLEFEDDDEAPSPQMITVPETLDVEALTHFRVNDQTGEEVISDEHCKRSPCFEDKDRQPHASLPDGEEPSQKLSSHYQPKDEQAKTIPARKVEREKIADEVGVPLLKSNEIHRFNPRSGQSSSSEAVRRKSKEQELRQSTLSQLFQKENLSKNLKAAQIVNDLTRDADMNHSAGTFEHTLRDVDQDASQALAGSKKEAADLFKMPFSSAQKPLSKTKPDRLSFKSKSKGESDRSLFDTERYPDHLHSISKDSKPSNFDLDIDGDDYEEIETRKSHSHDQSVSFSASMDETIAPNLLARQQDDAQNTFVNSPGIKGSKLCTQLKHSAGQRSRMECFEQSSTLKPSTGITCASPSQPKACEVSQNKSPGNKKSLKLNKSDSGNTNRQSGTKLTVREIAAQGARQTESIHFKNSNSNNNAPAGLAGAESSMRLDDASLSDDSDLQVFSDPDFDEETIAPSPQAMLMDSMPQQSVPCSSRSYKFGSKKHFICGDSLSRRAAASSVHVDEMDNDVSQPILLDGDDDIDDNGKENRFISEEDNQNLKNVKASPTKPAAVVDVKVEGTPFEPQESTLDEFEDSFDRVPREVRQEVPHIEVVRKRSERDKLEGFSCKQCHEYYKNSDLSEEELKKKMKICSRHKEKYKPPDTPEHFWTLGFPDTAEIIDRQNPSQRDRETPGKIEKRPRRRRQLQMKF